MSLENPYSQWIILDSCCAINLYASGIMDDILKTLDVSVALAQYCVEKEIIWIYDANGEKIPIDLSDLISSGQLEIVSLESENENLAMVNFAVSLDDGEAVCAAVALNRNWMLATDERKAKNHLSLVAPSIQITSTPDIIKRWVEVNAPTEDLIKSVILKIRVSAQYRPPRDHPLYDWWDAYLR